MSIIIYPNRELSAVAVNNRSQMLSFAAVGILGRIGRPNSKGKSDKSRDGTPVLESQRIASTKSR